MSNFLPMTRQELNDRGWQELDIIIVTGDAYVDHPSYGAAVIGRVLEAAGFKVGIIAQPDPSNPDDFKRLGRPRLFFGVTAGNLDSMLANYTANKKPRSDDEYSPGGKAGRRPDRATFIYINKLKQFFSNVPIVIGGMEASMRRFAHYDYWSDTVRRSILLDSKADMLVYGMGESQITEIARRLDEGESIKNLDSVRGTVIIRNSLAGITNYLMIPSYDTVAADKAAFNAAFVQIYRELDPIRGQTIVQPHAERFIIQLPPAMPLSSDEMDRIYDLPFTRKPHPSYKNIGTIPGLETVKFSVISHRGCAGECSFCSLYAHQGRIIQSRSAQSILREISSLAAEPDFKGTITDIGGPTANLYEAHCAKWKDYGACRDRRCLVPEECKNLKLGYRKTLDLWKQAALIPRVKHIFIGSGLRYDLLTHPSSAEYLKELCKNHISGRLKVAPEHTETHVLKLMQKPAFRLYEEFVGRFDVVNKELRKEQFLVNYLIVGHPGTTLQDALNMALQLKKMHINPEQIQDYIPLPMTVSCAMYHTEMDPFSGERVYVARNIREKKLQRALIQYKNPDNKRYVIEALRNLKKTDLLKEFYG